MFNLFGIAGAAVAITVTNRLGIRRIAIFGYVIVIIALLLLYAGGPHLSLAIAALLIGLFIFGHSFGPGAQGMTMATLSYPTRIRGVGTGWGQSMVRVGSIFGFYFFPVLVAAIGFRSMMLALVLVPLPGLLAALLVHWEPIGHDPDVTEEMSLSAGE